jgi:hypothetical protein
MHKSKIFKIGFALAIVAVPFHTHALSRQAGLEACAEAMVNDLATSQGVPMVLNLDPASSGGKVRMRRSEVFHLDAKDPDSHLTAKMPESAPQRLTTERFLWGLVKVCNPASPVLTSPCFLSTVGSRESVARD